MEKNKPVGGRVQILYIEFNACVVNHVNSIFLVFRVELVETELHVLYAVKSNKVY